MTASGAVPGDWEERAFVVPEPSGEAGERGRPTLRDELALALERRSAWGLPTDARSLLDAVRDARQSQMSSGSYWTHAESRDSQALDELPALIAPILEPFHEVLAGESWSWEGHKRVFVVGVVGDRTAIGEALRALPGTERVRLVERCVPEVELGRIDDAVWGAEAELEAAGISLHGGWVDADEGVYELTVAGPDEEAGRRWLTDRFGEHLRLQWTGTGVRQPQPRPFASWTAAGSTLTVHSWHDHNGEQPGPCAATEHRDRIDVQLSVLVPTGFVTLIGGWVPVRATIVLAAPVGSRRVIDASAGVARPSWDALSDAPEPTAAPGPDPAEELAARIRSLPRDGAAIVAAVEEAWGRPVADAMIARLRARIRDPAVLALAEELLDAVAHPDTRRAVRVGLIEDTLLIGPFADVAALRAADGPRLRAAVAAVDALLGDAEAPATVADV